MNNLTKASMTTRSSPVLRFTPTAWAKLLYLRDAGNSEIGGFGVTRPDDLLLVEDIGLVRQRCTPVHVAFDDEAVADFFDAQVDVGRRPEQFARLWIHTHPGSSPQPSRTDEETFARVFGRAEWAVMFIVARGGQSYARLRFNVGPGASVLVPVDVVYKSPFPGSDAEGWQQEYEACVHIPEPEKPRAKAVARGLVTDVGAPDTDDWRDAWADYLEFDRPLEEPDCEYNYDF